MGFTGWGFGFGYEISGLRISGFEVSGSGFRVPGFGVFWFGVIEISGWCFEVRGFAYRVSVSGFTV